MVYYFTSNLIHPPATIYFHADNLSSAHIYLRLAPEQTWDALPKELVEECAQLTKANSIEGNKKDNVTIIYTPWSNLHKNAGMATGQVGFFDQKKTKKVLIPTRQNPIINRLEKTRQIRSVDELPADKEAYLSQQRAKKRVENDKRKKEEEKVARERREDKERRERGYQDLMAEGGRSNEEGFDEDDFM
ncbi:MAG: hypothetical protein ASARMPRED_009019 [Alectoria sarmentosa]|nr:MAG: hypothetical protein ASARMPRED_009019 [Alectoria sarmentosa]